MLVYHNVPIGKVYRCLCMEVGLMFVSHNVPMRNAARCSYVRMYLYGRLLDDHIPFHLYRKGC